MVLTSRKPASHCRGKSAFTLVEIMVAIVILALITVLMAGIFGGTQKLVAQSNTSMGSLDAGETVLFQLGLDISRMVLRDDVDYDFTKQTGNDRLSFYARTTGFGSTGATTTPRPLSVVSYQVGTNPSNVSSTALQLNYGALQIDWGVSSPPAFTTFTLSALASGAPNQFLTTGSSAGDLPLPSATSYTTLADEVVRFEYCYVLKVDPGNNSPPQLLTPTVPTSLNGAPPIENLAGLLVGIVVVDPHSRLLFPPGADVKLAAIFVDPTTNNQDLLTLWTPLLTPAKLTAIGIPAKALDGIHIYQRYFALPW